MTNDSILNKIFSSSKRKKIFCITLIIILLIINTFLVYITGGIPNAFSHAMYIPVLVAAIFCGPIPAVIVGLVGGMLVGPFMALDFMLATGEPFINSLYRSVSYAFIGLFVGIIFKYLERQNMKLQHEYLHDLKTDLPNLNSYLQIKQKENFKDKVLLVIQINNQDDLSILLGNENYNQVLVDLYNKLKEFLPAPTHVTFVNERRFRVELTEENYDLLSEDIPKFLEGIELTSNDIPLFIDYIIGVSLSDPNKDIWTRLRESLVACLFARNHNKKMVIYKELYEHDQAIVKMLGALPQAIKNNELMLMYQPVISLKDNKCKSLEALVRWQRVDGLVAPLNFIPLAEKTRIINLITEWVLTQVIQDYPQLQETTPNIKIAVNISQRDLHEISFIKHLIQIVHNSKVVSKDIEVEITESTLMLNKIEAEECLKTLEDSGFSLILDDFGNGYSSLYYLKDLPVHKIKIDRSFISGLASDEKSVTLVQTIIDLAHNMGFEVVAEGIETTEVLEKLRAMGCDYAQGYLISHPVKKAQIVEWLNKQK